MDTFLDSRNIDLWSKLTENFEIRIEESANEEYSCFTINNEAVIYVNSDNICLDSFTHELLHVYLKYKHFHLGSSIVLELRQSKILSRIFSDELTEHIGNCLDHIKMYDKFIELGFQSDKFLYDYNDHKCSDIELTNLKRNYKVGKKVNTVAVDYYIGKLVAIFCDPNKSHDYLDIIPVFKKLDNKLFDTIYQLVEETKLYDIENDDILVSYRDISNTFYRNLVSWIKTINI